MDAEGARALARRIAARTAEADEAGGPAAAGSPAGQTLPQRLSEGPPSDEAAEQEEDEEDNSADAAAEPWETAELRQYARALEERLVDGRSIRVAVWWCRARVRGLWQTPFVVREEVVPGSPPAPNGSPRPRRAR